MCTQRLFRDAQNIRIKRKPGSRFAGRVFSLRIILACERNRNVIERPGGLAHYFVK